MYTHSVHRQVLCIGIFYVFLIHFSVTEYQQARYNVYMTRVLNESIFNMSLLLPCMWDIYLLGCLFVQRNPLNFLAERKVGFFSNLSRLLTEGGAHNPTLYVPGRLSKSYYIALL